ncbi:MAG: PVC-type heme-binding CxxCH protein, partial [Limisphaerales bacterium]
VVSPLRPDMAPVSLRGRDFSFDPRTLDFRAEGGGAQHGMSFDAEWNKYVCSNSDHIQSVVYDPALAGVNPLVKALPARVSIAEDGPAAPVFRISPDEPWRVIRTRWRVAGAVSGPVEGGGTPSGYFTGATGVTIFTGDAWAETYRGDAWIADCGSNLVHRKQLIRQGPQFSARRPLDEQNTEFLRSSEHWFRPVQFANGPDGNLYVLDLHRELIAHPST